MSLHKYKKKAIKNFLNQYIVYILYILFFIFISFSISCLFNDSKIFNIILSLISILSFLLPIISLILSLIIKQTTNNINNYININIQQYYTNQKIKEPSIKKEADNDYQIF